MKRAILLAILLAGCVRVGPGEDLHFVCEEKSGSPRMAYGLEFLVSVTRVNGTLDDASRLRILEAARHHLITFRGAEHAGFDAELSRLTPSAWRFVAIGVWEGDRPPDRYDVTIQDLDGEASAPLIEAPRTIRDAAWRAANESADAGSGEPGRATWDPEAPSCVRLAWAERTVVVNVVQARVVALEGA